MHTDDPAPGRRACGRVKVPGGKLVRVTLRGRRPHWRCVVDGDFFAADGADAALDRMARLVEDRLPGMFVARDGSSPTLPDARALDEWYRSTVRALGPLVDGALVGASAEAIALAALRALARADASLARALDEFEDLRDRRAEGRRRLARTGTERAERLVDEAEARARWRALAPRVVVDVPRMPEEQMRVDDAWALQVARGERPATLRVWDWAAPAVICGRHQSIGDEVDLRVARERGVHVVRRGSGGGAMFVEPAHTITYSLYAPARFARGLDVRASFQLCDMWLLEALRSCGVDAWFAGLNDIAGPNGKIGGAAQRRVAGPVGCLLHHDTLAYDIDARAMGEILNVSAEKLSDKAVRSADKRVGPMRAQTDMTRDEIVARMVRVARRFGEA